MPSFDAQRCNDPFLGSAALRGRRGELLVTAVNLNVSLTKACYLTVFHVRWPAGGLLYILLMLSFDAQHCSDPFLGSTDMQCRIATCELLVTAVNLNVFLTKTCYPTV